ncbi:hypothetical protein I0D00_08175 [Pseudomonas lalucatii]|uniref:Uncharacterized protein n=1 Tax=Pseudomonas lalucatii TaxID=1424203 RepID=A0ABS5Q0U8_9PSED|nr:hypothetical protein [Pseudomonas lalucatii]MBS7661923.1 hypothetical protein [Pseudomonas lalucatii]MBS7726211.1 hypothetical protein [Pseudomonas lalucatii]QVM88218.1 hypothetical protein I0D68_05320 [Pseudomonas lalucatii]
MLIVDRVLCDLCLAPMGQLHNLPAEQRERLSDFRTAPDYAICPDCLDASQPVANQAEPGNE